MEVRPGYKHTDVGVIPEDWDVPQLRQHLLQGATYGVVKAGAFQRTGIPMLRGGDIKGGAIADDQPRITAEKSTEYTRTVLKERDVVIALVGYPGEAAVVPKRLAGANISRAVGLLRPAKTLLPDFLACYLNSPNGRKEFLRPSAGSAQIVVNLAALNQLRFPLPREPEQRAIAAALIDADALLGGVDRLIVKKRALKQAAMQQLLTGDKRLPGFHGEWVLKELGEIGSISGAGVDKKIRPGEPRIRLVNYMDVYRRSFIRSGELDHVVSASPDQVARCAVRKGDVFFTPSSEMPFDIAASAVAVEDIPDACYSYHIVRLRLHEDWDLRYRAYAFKTRAFLDQASRTSEGSGVRYVITQSKFRELKIRYPSERTEQGAIAAVLADMDAELAALEARREKTRALKQAMMQELLTGKTRLVPAGTAHA